MPAKPPPTISVTLSIKPTNFLVGDEVELSVTAVSHASECITILTWPTIFNLDLAQRRRNFKCVDLKDPESEIRLALSAGPKRGAFNRARGSNDDKYFHTLEPEKPLVFSDTFGIAHRASHGSPYFLPGHRYRFGVQEDEEIRWWRKGTRDEVMTPEGSSGGMGNASGKPIMLTNIEPIEFTILAPNDTDQGKHAQSAEAADVPMS
ncbi:hypothetical protein Q7P37_005245 [Cladosporium fusiforme]